jgi:membrane protein DedA with SNARE-associated domain/rhodanese-related sulfurtransferase
MTSQLATLIAQYGLLLVFLGVLAEQAGLPVPAMPILVLAGAAAASGKMSLLGIVLVALGASLLSDLMWYWAGRRFGTRMMRTLCRISVSPDSCVHRSELHFERWRGRSLLIAKFVPGLSMVAPPLVGALGLRLRTFVLLDGLGALLWIGVSVGLGYAFAPQVDQLLSILADAGTLALELVLGLLAVYVLAKWWRRHRLRVGLRMARITVAELAREIGDNHAPLVFDVRTQTSRQLDPRIIDGAVPADLEHIDRALHGVPFDRELVIYCNCPNEATSASAAKSLIARGYQHVRPLQGGLAAWTAAGHPVQQLPHAGADLHGAVDAQAQA